MPVLSNLRHVRYLLIFVGVAFLVFDINYFLMKSLPGSRDEMCVTGANFTPLNIVFALALSALVGLLIAGFVALFTQATGSKKVGLTSLSGIGAGVGMMTVFCTICTIPVISLFGLSIGLEVFTYYGSVFKVASLVSLVMALYLLNRQLKRECAVCVPKRTRA